MKGAVSSGPLPRVYMRVGVSGCLNGVKVSQNAKMTMRPKPEASVPNDFGVAPREGRIVDDAGKDERCGGDEEHGADIVKLAEGLAKGSPRGCFGGK